MSEEQKCERCGAPLGGDRPEGLCPRCLMSLNLSTQTDAPTGDLGPGGTKVVPPPPEPPPLVSEIAPHFPQLEILECLGRGGMGVVYRARQPKLDRLVALKVLAREKEREPRFAERFLREARALARLSHPNIVAVHDFGETGGLCYLLMEYVDGLNLRQLMRGGTVTPEQALGIVPPICEALQYAHQQGIVHRDIKPENILVDKQGRVKIADFGIAKMLNTTGPVEPLTAEQQAVGTPHYMAPEQVEKPQTVDHRADIYSLGVVFYEMLTGELPLGKFSPPSQKVHIDVRLDEVVLHALEKEPSRRYQQASQVKTDVESITRDEARATKSQPGQGGAPAPALSSPADAASPWHQVKGPALGLMATGILCWLAVPVLLVKVMLTLHGPLKNAVVLVPVAALLLGGILFTAGLLMKRLTAYWFSVGAAGLAVLSAPGSLIGLPIGLWALVVLSRREVRQAFGRGLALPPPAPSREGWAWKLAAAGGALALLILALPVGAILLAIVVPAAHRSVVTNAPAVPPLPRMVLLQGRVLDAATGRPIPGARVADTPSGSDSARAPLQSWTDLTGHYRLYTWAEAHTVVASASGYEAKSVTVSRGSNGKARTAAMKLDFELVPTNSTLAEATTGEPKPPAAPAAPRAPGAPAAAPVRGLADTTAQVQLGSAFWQHGEYQKALQLLLPAAEQGNPVAQHRLGVMYVRGDGVEQDFVEATRWFRLAAEQGQGESQYSMGMRYLEGQGVPRDGQEAARWFGLAAEQGIGAAASRLAQVFAEGRGVPRDNLAAYKWLKIAGEDVQGGAQGLSLRDLRRRLSPDQVAQAELEARLFVPKRVGPADF